MITKTDIIKAIDEVIYTYQNNIYNHGFGTCPLCLLYRSELHHTSCGNCPNKVFVMAGFDSVGCIRRGGTHNLNFGEESDTENLIQYWKKVRAFLNKKPAIAVITLDEETKRGILEIANKYKR